MSYIIMINSIVSFNVIWWYHIGSELARHLHCASHPPHLLLRLCSQKVIFTIPIIMITIVLITTNIIMITSIMITIIMDTIIIMITTIWSPSSWSPSSSQAKISPGCRPQLQVLRCVSSLSLMQCWPWWGWAKTLPWQWWWWWWWWRDCTWGTPRQYTKLDDLPDTIIQWQLFCKPGRHLSRSFWLTLLDLLNSGHLVM